MKKLLFLFGFIFLFSNVQAQDLAFAETKSSLPMLSQVEFEITGIYKDSLFFAIEIDGLWNGKASSTTNQKTSNYRKGSKGAGYLKVTGRKTGQLKITELNGRKLSRSRSHDLKFSGRAPNLR